MLQGRGEGSSGSRDVDLLLTAYDPAWAGRGGGDSAQQQQQQQQEEQQQQQQEEQQQEEQQGQQGLNLSSYAHARGLNYIFGWVMCCMGQWALGVMCDV